MIRMSEFVNEVFGGWWGAVEFAVLSAVVLLVSYIGAKTLSNHFVETAGRPKPEKGCAWARVFKSEEDRATVGKTSHFQENSIPTKGNNGKRVYRKPPHQALTIPLTSGRTRCRQGGGAQGVKCVMKRVAPHVKHRQRGAENDITKKFKWDQYVRHIALTKIDNDTLAISLTDGTLPESVSNPFFIDLYVESLTTSSALLFRDVQVDCLSQAVYINIADAAASGGTNPIEGVLGETHVHVKIVCGNHVLFDGSTALNESLVDMERVFYCKNFVLFKLNWKSPPVYNYYSPQTLGREYVSGYPLHMPSRRQTQTLEPADEVTTETVDTHDKNFLFQPTVSFVYTNQTHGATVLTRDLYEREVKHCTDRKYFAQRVDHTNTSTVNDPTSPKSTLLSLYVPESTVPGYGQYVLIGWVASFQNTGSDNGSAHSLHVIPARYQPTDGQHSHNLSLHMHTNLKPIVIHNTKIAVGVFGDTFKIDPTINGRGWAGPQTPEFFSTHLRPCVLLGETTDDRVTIRAVFSAPATKYAATETTTLLPRLPNVRSGPLPLPNTAHTPNFTTHVMGGSVPTYSGQSKVQMCNYYAVFEPLRDTIGTSEPYQPLHSLVPVDEQSIFAGTLSGLGHPQFSIAIDTPETVVTVRDVQTKGLLAKKQINSDTGTSQRGRSVQYMILDGLRAGENTMEIGYEFVGDKRLAMQTDGNLIGNFVHMEALEEDKQYDLWVSKQRYNIHEKYQPVRAVKNTDRNLYMYRSIGPPLNDSGFKEPYNVLTSFVAFPQSIPVWAFPRGTPATRPHGNGRHIYVCSVRRNEDPEYLDPSPYFNRISRELVPRGNELGTSHPVMYLDEEAPFPTEKKVDGSGGTKNEVAWIICSDGNKYENVLGSSEDYQNDSASTVNTCTLCGPWGLILFGANCHPRAIADSYTTLKKSGRLNLAVCSTGECLPVMPLSHKLAVWPKGNTLQPTDDTPLGLLLRLDPRAAGIGSANGFYNPSGGVLTCDSLILVALNEVSGQVLYAVRLPLYMLKSKTPNSNVFKDYDLIDRNAYYHRRLWNFTHLNGDTLCLSAFVSPVVTKSIRILSERGVNFSLNVVDNLVFAVNAHIIEEERNDFYDVFKDPSNVDLITIDGKFNGIYVASNFNVTCGYKVAIHSFI